MTVPAPGILLCAVAVTGLVLWGIVFVLFGQVTVRRLRRNPCTRDALGVDFLPGREILNVAEALTLPRRFTRLLRSGPLRECYADPDLLALHARPVDRWLGRACYVLMYVDGVLMAAVWFAIC